MTLNAGRIAALLVLLLGMLCGAARGAADDPPRILLSDVRGARGEAVSVKITGEDLPENVRVIAWKIDLGSEPVTSVALSKPGVEATIQPMEEGSSVYTARVESATGIGNGEVAILRLTLPGSLTRQPMILREVTAELSDGSSIAIAGENATFGTSLITKPVTLFAFFCGVVACIYWVASIAVLQGFFRFFPPLIWMYFVPMVATTLGITPDMSSLYSPFMSRIILPAILVLLLIPSDVRAIAKLGPKALIVMLIATTGIVLGAVGSFWLFQTFMPDSLPPDTWKGVAALSGSWIGGSPNMFAVLESVGTPPNIIGPLVVVDTVLAYSWLGLLIALSAYQVRIDKAHGADSRAIDEISVKLEEEQRNNARAPRTADVAYMFGIAFVVSQICLAIGVPLFDLAEKAIAAVGATILSGVVNAYGWGILLITAAGLILSTTKVRHLDYCGASSLGYTGLYLMLTTYGAQANLQAILEVPAFFGLGFVWLVIHVVILYIGVRVTKAPLFLGATSSMANIGGTASAPVVAASYNASMAPVGLLMAILGSVMGTPVALFVVATICRRIAGG